MKIKSIAFSAFINCPFLSGPMSFGALAFISSPAQATITLDKLSVCIPWTLEIIKLNNIINDLEKKRKDHLESGNDLAKGGVSTAAAIEYAKSRALAEISAELGTYIDETMKINKSICNEPIKPVDEKTHP